MKRIATLPPPEFDVFAGLRRTVTCETADRASENVEEGDIRPADAHVRGAYSGDDSDSSRPCFDAKINVVFADLSLHSGRRSREDEGYEQPV